MIEYLSYIPDIFFGGLGLVGILGIIVVFFAGNGKKGSLNHIKTTFFFFVVPALAYFSILRYVGIGKVWCVLAGFVVWRLSADFASRFTYDNNNNVKY